MANEQREIAVPTCHVNAYKPDNTVQIVAFPTPQSMHMSSRARRMGVRQVLDRRLFDTILDSRFAVRTALPVQCREQDSAPPDCCCARLDGAAVVRRPGSNTPCSRFDEEGEILLGIFSDTEGRQRCCALTVREDNIQRQHCVRGLHRCSLHNRYATKEFEPVERVFGRRPPRKGTAHHFPQAGWRKVARSGRSRIFRCTFLLNNGRSASEV